MENFLYINSFVTTNLSSFSVFGERHTKEEVRER